MRKFEENRTISDQKSSKTCWIAENLVEGEGDEIWTEFGEIQWGRRDKTSGIQANEPAWKNSTHFSENVQDYGL